MAKIVKTNQQEESLKIITNNIKIIEKINKLINFKDTKSSKLKINLINNIESVNEQLDFPFDLIYPILNDYRKILIKNVNELTKKFNIELEENDINILENKEPENIIEIKDEEFAKDSFGLENEENNSY